MRFWISASVVIAGVAFSAAILAQAPPDSPTAAAPGDAAIRLWISQLGSNDYGVRQEATRNLERAGRAALPAVAAAAQQDDLEVTTRAVAILRTMLETGEGATEDAAAAALEKVAHAQATSAARLAADILVEYEQLRQDRAIEEIRRLGGTIIVGNPRTGRTDCHQVVLGKQWLGGRNDLLLLRRIVDLEWLSFHSVALTDGDVPAIEGLARLSTLELFGTKITPAGLEQLRSAYPTVRIDLRKGAMLGVSGGSDGNGCRIDLVQAGTAAEAAGLQPGDVIVKFQEHPITDFDDLTAQIATCEAGDKVMIELHRGEETLRKEVTLGQWQ